MGLTWSTYPVHDSEVLALVGQLTSHTVLQVEAQLARLLTRTGSVLVIDLAQLRDCDSAGVAILEGCRRAGVVAGVDVRLAAPSPSADRALRASGVMDTVAVFGTVDAAARGDVLDRLSSRPVDWTGER
jgi:anti-sigma B factor antagonist